MIVDLKKILIIGAKAKMDRFFEHAQKAGFLEFIGLAHKKALELPEEAKTILSAIKISRHHNPHGSYVPIETPLEVAQTIVQHHADFERFLEEKRMLKAEIARVAPFGDFSREELDALEEESRRFVQFFAMKGEQAGKGEIPEEMIYLGTSFELSYFMTIQKEKKQYPKCAEVLIDIPLGELKKQLSAVQLEILKTERHIHDLAKATHYLQEGFYKALNSYELDLVKHDTVAPLGEALFAIEAWIPETKIKSLLTLAATTNVVIEEIAIEPSDKVPTYMENEGAARIGEDLVKIYDAPAPTDKDPSLWVLLFFSFFFAVIISDAGYGLIYLLLGLYAKKKNPNPTPIMRRFIKLVMIASTSCIIWGIATASVFGIQIGPDNPLRKTSFLHYMGSKKAEYHMRENDDVYQEYIKLYPEAAGATNGHDFFMKASREVDGHQKFTAMEEFYDSVLLEFSLFVGLIHILLSFARNLPKNIAGIGWICFLIGGYLYFPSFVEATSFITYMGWISKATAYAVGEKMLYSGLGAVFVISLLQGKKWGALHELTNAVQVFADVLSYLRLYALALAGVMMASTFNDLGVQMGFFGFIVILLGHSVNLTLAIMSGVIHGLRLNFLEWYHYSFEGGGRSFSPLRIHK